MFYRLTQFSPNEQIIDETGIADTTKVDIQLLIDWKNLSEVNKSLALYGLAIKEEERELDCIIIKATKE